VLSRSTFQLIPSTMDGMLSQAKRRIRLFIGIEYDFFVEDRERGIKFACDREKNFRRFPKLIEAYERTFDLFWRYCFEVGRDEFSIKQMISRLNLKFSSEAIAVPLEYIDPDDHLKLTQYADESMEFFCEEEVTHNDIPEDCLAHPLDPLPDFLAGIFFPSKEQNERFTREEELLKEQNAPVEIEISIDCQIIEDAVPLPVVIKQEPLGEKVNEKLVSLIEVPKQDFRYDSPLKEEFKAFAKEEKEPYNKRQTRYFMRYWKEYHEDRFYMKTDPLIWKAKPPKDMMSRFPDIDKKFQEFENFWILRNTKK